MTEASSAAFICPSCKHALPGSTHRVTCGSCGVSYPVLVTGIPVLLREPDPDIHLASTALTLRAQLDQTNASVDALTTQLAVGSRRPRALEHIRRGGERISTFLRRALGALDHTWPLATMPKGGATGADVRGQLLYFVRDFGGQPAAEAVLDQVTRCLLREAEHSGSSRSAVVLGAGGGRFVWELAARFDHVVAVELSPVAALCWAMLAKGAVELTELDEQNVATVDEICTPVSCRLPDVPDRTTRLARIHWVVADGCVVPRASASTSAVFSVYFTDRVAAHAVVAEAARLLEVGGVFVHFGPFGFEHQSQEDMITAEELGPLLESRGFRVVSRSWVSHLLMPTARLVQPTCKAYVCTAVKL